MNCVEFRGVRLSGSGPDELTSWLLTRVAAGRGSKVSFVNPHSFNLLATVPGLLHDLRQMDLVCADGIGVTWVVRLLTRASLQRLSFDLLGPRLFAEVARHGHSVFLIGGRPHIAAAAAAALQRSHPGLLIAGTRHGYVDTGDMEPLAKAIDSSGAALVLIGAGAPIQEHIAYSLGELLPRVSFVTCGGYFDQVIRPAPYYPRWAYPLRLNWLVRLVREPRRLWRRYLLGIPRFFIDSVVWRLRHRGA